MRRLAIFLDGTWNTLNNNTNVWRLKSLDVARPPISASTTRRASVRSAARWPAAALRGTGIDDEIIDAYTWLIQNFDDGDEIFIFGFSRGAYTARSLSGLICKCGVLKLGAPLSIEQLYARYRIYVAPTIRSLLGQAAAAGCLARGAGGSRSIRARRRSGSSASGTPSVRWAFPLATAAAKFTSTASSTRICVSTTSTPSMRLRSTNTARNFEPTFWTRTVKAGRRGARGTTDRATSSSAGSLARHANVGGGYASDPLAQRPLKWLMDKAARLGLVFRDQVSIDKTQIAPPSPIPIASSDAGFYRFFSRAVLSSVGRRARQGNAGHDVANQRDDRWIGVRSLACRRDVSSAKPRRVGEAERQVDPATLAGAVRRPTIRRCRRP